MFHELHVDDEGGTDLTVHVDGEEYQAEATVDADGDGIDDTATITGPDGGTQAFTDTDADGVADELTFFDPRGEQTGRAVYDPATGDWVGVEPGEPEPDTRAIGGQQGDIVVETPSGDRNLGPATNDTDFDGRNDSVVVSDEDRSVIFTDVDDDGIADVATQINNEGEVAVAEHRGDGEWTTVSTGSVTDGPDTPPDEQRLEGWDDGRDAPVAVDPTTGEWTEAR